MVLETLLPWLEFLLLLVVVAGAFYVMHLKMRHRAHYGVGHFGDSTAEKTNCPECGTRVSADSGTCEYCGEPLGSDGASEDRSSAAKRGSRTDREREHDVGET